MKALKSGFWYTVSNFLTRAIVFITTPVFARILTTSEFGDFHVYANWQSLLLIFCSLEFSLTINRARLDYDENELKNYIGNTLLVSGIITLVLFLIVMCFDGIRSKLLMLDREYVYVMFTYLFFYPAFELFQSEQRVKYNYRLSAALSFLSVLSGALLAVLGAFLFKDRLLGRVVGQYLPVVLLGITFWSLYVCRIKKINVEYCKYALGIAEPLVISYLGSQILASSDKIVVQHLCTSEAVAFIGITTSCSHIMTILIQSLNNAWAPWFYDKLEEKQYEQINKIFGIYMMLIVLCTFGVILLGPELILILGGSKYNDALPLIPPSISFCIFNLIIFQFINIETYYKRTKFAAIATGCIAIINVLLDIIFVKLFGFIAASFVTVLCYAILMLLHSLYVNRLCTRKLVQKKVLLFSIISVICIIMFSYIAYINTIIRYCLIGILFMNGLFILMKTAKRISLLKGEGRIADE